MKFFVKSFLLILAICLLSGCAFTTDQVALDYQLTPVDQLDNKIQQPVSIAVQVYDVRTMANPKFMFHKLNGYNMEMPGGFVAEKPIAMIVTQALQQGLAQMNYQVKPNAPNTLRAEIVSVAPHLTFTKFYLQINLSLKAYHGTTLVWQGVIIGTANAGLLIETEQMARTVFSKALTNAIRQLQHSKSFNQAFSG